MSALLIGVPEVERPIFEAALEEAGFAVHFSSKPPVEGLADLEYSLIVVDLRGDFDAMQVIDQLHVGAPESGILALVPNGELPLAVLAMKMGARLCLSLPLKRERLLATAATLRQTLKLEGEVDRMKRSLRLKQAEEGIVGSSPAIGRCLGLARLVADYPLNVLLTGESGVGKESMASYVHQCSGRSEGPFVAVDCGALSEDLADAELFGHKKGAFTGAEAERLGRFVEADGGTLFLDEIGNLPLALQAKLLRVLQAREVWPLGAQEARPVDLRIIAATNEDLPALVKAGRFRLDLFHRLQEFTLRVPSLRERKEDIRSLALYFLSQLSRRFNRETPGLDEAAAELLICHPWPGNIRQLQNAMKHACVMAKERVELDDLPAELLQSAAEEAPPEPNTDGQFFNVPAGILSLWQAEEYVTKEVERQMISEALLLQRGDKESTAEALGIHTKTLVRKLKEHGLTGLAAA